MEYNTLLDWVMPFITPAPPEDFKTYVADNPTLLEQYADLLMWNLPLPRYKWYQPSNFQKLREDVTEQTNQVVENLGYYMPRTCMPLLQTVGLYSSASLLLGLLFGIIELLFIVISVLLIYSLLMISVETKTFENGVMRMLGLSKGNCISMILIQSCLFVFPSIIMAYIASIPTLALVYSFMFKGQDFSVPPIPRAGATAQALVLGLLIPTISSIIPIQNALNKQLNESLTNSRSKTRGQKVEVTDADSLKQKLPYLISGGIAAGAGITIYFVLPLSILTFNLGLLLEIFFLILIGMILGLTLIAFNLQRIFELIVVYLLLFFERKSMKLLIVKNLSAHRESNRLTSIIYSLTLGSVIFIVVAANLQLSLFQKSPSQDYGDIDL